MFIILIMVMASQMYTYVKYFQITHLKNVQFNECELKHFKFRLYESSMFLLVYYHLSGEKNHHLLPAFYNSYPLFSILCTAAWVIF